MGKRLNPWRAAIVFAALAMIAGDASARVKTADEILGELTGAPAPHGGHGVSHNMSLEVTDPGAPPAPVSPPPARPTPAPAQPATQPAAPTPPPTLPRHTSNLDIYFDFNSASIKPESSEQLRQLVAALASPQVADKHFGIIGHTDAKGSDASNLRLSLQRAAAVFEALTTRYGISPTRLFVQGQGKRSLTGNPQGAENRRVEIVNLF